MLARMIDRRTVLALMIAPLAGSAFAQDAPPPDPLSALRGVARPLYLFAPSAEDARLVEQRKAIETAYPGFAERDQVLVTVAGEEVSVLGPPRLAALVPGTMGASTADALRKRMKVGADEFAVVLVGKDGGEKMRQAEPLGTEALFKTVDAMPMRQSEVKERS